MTVLQRPVHEMLYQDGWHQGEGPALEVHEPATGELLAVVATDSIQQVGATVRAAAAAQREWSATPFDERANVLRKAASLVDDHTEELATWLVREGGGSRIKVMAELGRSKEELIGAAALLSQPSGELLPIPHEGRVSYARRIPLGVVGVIAPWNWPFLLALRSVAPALALGNAVVLKPAPDTPVSGGVLLERVLTQAGLPADVFQIVLGDVDVGEALVGDENIAMVSFTGSTRGGRRVGELAGSRLKKVLLELGGNCPHVVLEDADVELAAGWAAFSTFLNQGQNCISASRHLVHESVVDAYCDALVARAEALTVGDPFKDGSMVGPIINERQLRNVQRLVAESVAAGARVLTGATSEGPFFAPTVLAGVTPDMPVFAEEIFGPVAPVTAFSDDEDAVRLANMTEYGLAAAVHSRDAARAEWLGARIHSGMVHVNDSCMNDAAHVPFGGLGASGNGGAFGGTANWEAFTHWQWFTVRHRVVAPPF